MSFTHGTLNLYKRLGYSATREDLAEAIEICDVLGMQENWRSAANEAIEWLDQQPGWEVNDFARMASADPIAWNTEVFEALPGDGFLRTHKGKAGVTPPRFITWQPLRHKATGATVMVLNTHVINGYAGQDKAPRALRDADAKAHWQLVVDVTWRFREAYDVVLLSGDFNVRLANLDEPWYPGNLLKPLYVFDHGSGIDHTLFTHESQVHLVKHGTRRGLHSDHNLHFSVLELDQEVNMATGFMPGVLVKNIRPGANDPKILPCGVIYHVAVSRSDSLHDYFDGPSGGIESHFYVRSDGTIEQYRSIFYEADANSEGNSFYRGGVRLGFVSIETEGMGDGEWTSAQIAALKRITAWVRSQSRFPARVCPGPYASGVGYHRLFREWNPNAHACPGDARIRQFNDDIVPWLEAGADSEDWFDMATQRDLEQAIRNTRLSVKVGDETKEWRLEVLLGHLEQEQDATQRLLKQVLALLDAEKFSNLVASKINVDVTASSDEIKQAVKDALAEGVLTHG